MSRALRMMEHLGFDPPWNERREGRVVDVWQTAEGTKPRVTAIVAPTSGAGLPTVIVTARGCGFDERGECPRRWDAWDVLDCLVPRNTLWDVEKLKYGGYKFTPAETEAGS